MNYDPEFEKYCERVKCYANLDALEFSEIHFAEYYYARGAHPSMAADHIVMRLTGPRQCANTNK